jgi:hypothetical protein
MTGRSDAQGEGRHDDTLARRSGVFVRHKRGLQASPRLFVHREAVFVRRKGVFFCVAIRLMRHKGAFWSRRGGLARHYEASACVSTR